MTCIDKLRLDHPEWGLGIILDQIKSACPSQYLIDPEYCPDGDPSCACIDCWMRDIPEQGENSARECLNDRHDNVKAPEVVSVTIYTNDIPDRDDIIEQVFKQAAKIDNRPVTITIM